MHPLITQVESDGGLRHLDPGRLHWQAQDQDDPDVLNRELAAYFDRLVRHTVSQLSEQNLGPEARAWTLWKTVAARWAMAFPAPDDSILAHIQGHEIGFPERGIGTDIGSLITEESALIYQALGRHTWTPDPDDEGPTTETLTSEWRALHQATGHGIPELEEPTRRALNSLINRDPEAMEILAKLSPLPTLGRTHQVTGPTDPLRTELRDQALTTARAYKQAKLLNDFAGAAKLYGAVTNPKPPTPVSELDEDPHLDAFLNRFPGMWDEREALRNQTSEAIAELPYSPKGVDYIIAQEKYYDTQRDRIDPTYTALARLAEITTATTDPAQGLPPILASREADVLQYEAFAPVLAAYPSLQAAQLDIQARIASIPSSPTEELPLGAAQRLQALQAASGGLRRLAGESYAEHRTPPRSDISTLAARAGQLRTEALARTPAEKAPSPGPRRPQTHLQQTGQPAATTVIRP